METDRTQMAIEHGAKAVADEDMVMQNAVGMMSSPEHRAQQHRGGSSSQDLGRWTCAGLLFHAQQVAV